MRHRRSPTDNETGRWPRFPDVLAAEGRAGIRSGGGGGRRSPGLRASRLRASGRAGGDGPCRLVGEPARARSGPARRAARALGGPIDDATWDDVEETLIAGDVGASLAMRVVERARARRDTGGAEAAVQAELAALLVTRDGDWSP